MKTVIQTFVPVTQKTYCFYIIKASRFILFMELSAVYYKNIMKHGCTLCTKRGIIPALSLVVLHITITIEQ
jgi:hypothetical protein